MKIELNRYEVEVPQKFVEMFREAKKNALSENEDIDFWSQDESACFAGWMDDTYFDLIEKYSSKLCPSDIAEFLITWRLAGSDLGGYPVSWGITFEDNGYRYNVSTFGWTGDIEEDPKNNSFDTLASKEKIKEK